MGSEKGKIAKTLKIFLSKNTGPIWKLFLHKYSSTKIVQIIEMIKKNMAARAGPIFLICAL